MAKKRKLTVKEQLFVKYYLGNFFNATDAARKAGYSIPEASGFENLKKPNIQGAVKKTIDGLIKKSDDKIASVIKSLQIRAFYDVKEIVTTEGNLVKPLEEMGDLSQVIDGIDKRPVKGGGYLVVYKLASKDKSKELLGKYMSMFSERLEVTGKDGEPLPALSVSIPSGVFKKQ